MASSIDRKWKRDVFLSFRGEDTRNNFSGHLHASLERSGINTFKDDVKLQKGQEISPALLTAIEESRFSIVILSKNYASSTWCLDELVKILECKSNGQTVYPIFYDVGTSEVRKQEGSFGVELANHERTFKPNLKKVQGWRSALTEVANLSGWDSKNRYEPDLIQEIVQHISKQKLNSTKISIAKHPVGIQSHVQKISSLLEINSKEVRKVGIYGCQGVGKTTIAKAIYNWHASQFDGCSFLMDVRDKSKDQYQMVELQKLLLHEILGEDMKLGNVDRGITVIKERLCHKKVLIVIDGVEDTDPNPLDKLAGGLDWFGPGSRIIITTTEERVLNTQDDVHSIYPMKTMGQSEAIQLFSWYAFKKNKPEVDYMKLVHVVVRYSKGLPSALVKLGSDLCSRSMDYWESKLLKNNAIEGENHNYIWIRLNGFVERHYNDETKEMHPSLVQLFKGTLESPSDELPNFNMNALEQCDEVAWKDDDFDLQSIKLEQSAEETSHPNADRTRVDEISKQGMKAWQGQSENSYAGKTQDAEKGEQWRNASQGGSKNPYYDELGDDGTALQSGNYYPYYGGPVDDDVARYGGSKNPYYGGPTDHGIVGQGGSKNPYYGELGDDVAALQGGNYYPYYGGPVDDAATRYGGSKNPYYGGPTDHGVAGQGGSENPYYGELGDDNVALQGGNYYPYYGGPTDHGIAGQGGSENPYYGRPSDHDDFDLQSIKLEQSTEETLHPDADRTRVDEISKQGMKAWQGQSENPYASETQDAEKGEQWRNASQGGSKNPYYGELGDDVTALQGDNYYPYYGGPVDDAAARCGGSKNPYYGGPTDHGYAGQGGSENPYYGRPSDHDDFDLQSIKLEQSAEETLHPDADRTRVDEISKQGMKAWQGQSENPYAGETQDAEKGEQWRNASQGGSKNPYYGELGDDVTALQGDNYYPYYGGPTDHGVAGQGGSENPYYGELGDDNAALQGGKYSAYYGGPVDDDAARYGGSKNPYYSGPVDDNATRYGGSKNPYYGGPMDDNAARYGGSKNPYYGGPTDHGDAGQGGSENPYYGELGDDDAAKYGGSKNPYYGGPTDHGYAGQGGSENPYYGELGDDDAARYGGSKNPYYGGPTDHGVAEQSENYNPYYGGARNDDDDDGQDASKNPYYGGPGNDDSIGQGGSYNPYPDELEGANKGEDKNRYV